MNIVFMKTFCLFLVILIPALASVAQNHPPVAVNDTLTGYSGQKFYINLLKNDFDPDGDSIYVVHSPGMLKINDSTWEVHIYSQYLNATDSLSYHYYPYTIKDENESIAEASVVTRDITALRYDFLDINNISALISPVGQHFWDFEDARFEVPKGSGINALFNNTIWIGGINDSELLCTAAEDYRQSGIDYFAGPLSTVYDSAYLSKWSRVWKINKTDVQTHINNWSQSGYIPSEVIKNWPANGNTLLGQSSLIAPFYDLNNNRIYEPLSGDYPLLRGDECVFFILNDGKAFHSGSKSEPLGIEIYGMAYAFNKPDDSTLNNTIFVHCDIINRSQSNYHNTYLGLFADFDLGFKDDDFMGSDVSNGMLYAYNGTAVDGSGQPFAYGEHPPAVGMKIIGGPYLEPDGIDNQAGECNYGINGLNFGDQIADNERFGMSNSIVLIDFQPSLWGPLEPFVSPLIYNYLQSVFRDNNHLIYGGNGHESNGGLGPDCNFMFPGNSDTICNWGTNGILPNGGFNQNGYYWDEITTGNAPDDRRGIASVGPFNFAAGQTVPLDYCFTWARDYAGNNVSSAELLRQRVSGLKPDFPRLIGLPETYFGIYETAQIETLTVYPNPVYDQATVVYKASSNANYFLYSVNGTLISKGNLSPGKNLLNVSTLKSGVYIMKTGSNNVRIIKL
jgi:hypothetical protein